MPENEQLKRAFPLKGVRVVEMCHFHAGPTCTYMLGALGAEVIKVENPKKGDPMRTFTRLYGQDSTLPGGRSVAFEAYNGGKKAVTIDVASPEGKRAFYKLIAKSDVFVHNIRPETAVSLEIDYEHLIQHNPRLVFANITGFGPYGPEASRPGLDPVGLARSGMMIALSGGSQKPPILPPAGIADRMAGILTGFGVLTALLARDRTGTSQRVESSLLGGAMWLGQMNLQYALFTGKELLPLDHSSDPLLNSYRCKDGRWLFISAPSERAWPAFCAAIAKQSLASDPRFGGFEERWAHRHELIKIFEEAFITKTSAEWTKILAQHPEIVFEICRAANEISDDPQMLANDYLVEIDHPELGKAKFVGFPMHLNGLPVGKTEAAAAHGQHTEEVLLSLDYSWEEIEKLRDAGAI
jgi:crotonobetainyl-CoA:carnitine CoA-transferase CaiB-like acyl-CoA transferase